VLQKGVAEGLCSRTRANHNSQDMVAKKHMLDVCADADSRSCEMYLYPGCAVSTHRLQDGHSWHICRAGEKTEHTSPCTVLSKPDMVGAKECIVVGVYREHRCASTNTTPPACPSGVHMSAAGPRRFLPSGGRGGGAPVKMGKDPQGAERGLKEVGEADSASMVKEKIAGGWVGGCRCVWVATVGEDCKHWTLAMLAQAQGSVASFKGPVDMTYLTA
jgi:hypothetical protein